MGVNMRVLILGGYGNFGKIIAQRLSSIASVELVIAGRNIDKAKLFASKINADAMLLDAKQKNIASILKEQKIDVLISTAGPFQGQDYYVAESAIAAGCHYIDLADSKAFVCGITQLNELAKNAGVLVCSGASSVPGLSSAVVNEFLPRFSVLKKVMIGISTSEKAPGRATINGLFDYCGKPIDQLIDGHWVKRYGWQKLVYHKFTEPLGYRPLAACDIPDLTLFPRQYKTLETVSFSAGTGLKLTHYGTWFFSWLIRLGIIRKPQRYSRWMHKAASLVEFFGDGRSGMHVTLSGLDHEAKPLQLCWELIALNNDGVNIPCLASVALVRKMMTGRFSSVGAMSSMGLLTLDEYLEELKGLTFTTHLKEL